MAVIEKPEVEEPPPDPRKAVVDGLRLDVQKLRLERELAALQPNAPPDIGEQVTALAELVGHFQGDHNAVVTQLAALEARVAALEKAAS